MIVAISGILEDPAGNKRSAGSGKDEAAKALVEMGFVAVSIADVMKRFCMELVRQPGEPDRQAEARFWGSLEEKAAPLWEGGPSGREMLQTLGDWGRRQHPSLWIDYTLRTIERLRTAWYSYDRVRGVDPHGAARSAPAGFFIYGLDPLQEYTESARHSCYNRFVIPDCRDWNEVSRVREAGGKVLRVKRRALSVFEPDLHSTEQGLVGANDSEFDAVAMNNGTIPELHRKVRGIVEGWIG